MTQNSDDHIFMKQALSLATKGRGRVSPNPLVGSVIVNKNGEVIGEGHHGNYGGPHAEANALAKISESPVGATLYCNLEPCCHTNKQTPPCAQAIIAAKIKRVVVANLDPNPNVAGKGVELLRNHGIEVLIGVCREEGAKLNRVFFKAMTSPIPFIHLKVAQTLDGKMCTLEHDSKWISDLDARKEVHQLRADYDAVAVGRHTQAKDNPQLTARNLDDATYPVKSPYRLVFGDPLKMDLQGHIFKDDYKNKTIIISSSGAGPLEKLGISYLDGRNQSLKDIFIQLKEKYQIQSILVEGGPQFLSSLINENLFDQITVYIKPILLGNGSSMYHNDHNLKIEQGHYLEGGTWRVLNDQAVLEVHNNVHRTD